MSELCRKCGRELEPWHPGPPFECDPESICYTCELDMCFARRDRVQSSHLVEYLLRCRKLPFIHQVVGVETLVKRPDYFALFDEMGAGKTAQVIVAKQILYLQHKLDRVIVLSPAPGRDVWFDPELGELAKHAFKGFDIQVNLYHSRARSWGERGLHWLITNYEFIRMPGRLDPLLPLTGPRTHLVLDESSAVKGYRAEQTKASLTLRKKCAGSVLLNGTPIANNPLDMYAQGQLMDPKILDCKTFFHFRSKYARLGGFQGRQIIGWQNLEDLQRRFAPHVLRRLKKDCLDLPEKLEPVLLNVALELKTWAVYREMRDEMVAWLSHTEVAIASQAGVKAMRLAQICAGFLGGVQESEPQDEFDLEPEVSDLESSRPSFIPRISNHSDDQFVTVKSGPPNVPRKGPVQPVQEIGREVLDAYLQRVDELLEVDPCLKLLTWTRFRPELQRTLDELMRRSWKKVPEFGAIWGSQKKDARSAALRLLDPRTAPAGPVIVVGTTQTGSMSLNLAAAHTVIYLSNDFSLKTRLQSEDRVHRPPQRNVVSYTDVVVTGPAGQKTVSHLVLKALRNKEDIANWTTRAWLDGLREE